MIEEIYLLSAIETIINQKATTNLGTYSLEYSLEQDNIFNPSKGFQDSSLVIHTRFKNNLTKQVTGGISFSKTLKENSDFRSDDSYKMLENLLDGPLQEQLSFILKVEDPLTKNNYTVNNSPESNYFFEKISAIPNHLEVQTTLLAKLKELNTDVQIKQRIKS